MPSGTQRMRLLGTLICASALLVACADEELAVVASKIDVCIDGQLDECGTAFALGPIRAGRGLEIPLYIANRGSGELAISEVQVVSGPVEIVRYPATVESGSARITLTGWDVALGEGEATLRFVSSDPEKPNLDVQLTYEGVESVIVVCPAEAESLQDESCGDSVATSLADVRRGDTKVFQVWVGNIGLAPLRVFGAQVEGRSSVAGEFSLQTSTTDGIIQPQERRLIGVTYQPQDDIADEMLYGIYEAGRDDVSATWALSGVGRPNTPPEADIQTESNLGRIGELIELSGEGSMDPEGDPLQFKWSFISIPRASTLELYDAVSDQLYFMPDVAGRYEVQLSVTDSVGASDSETVVFDIGMGDSLQIDLIWDPTLGDLDLHLVPEGGAMFAPENCSFQTPFRDLNLDGVPDGDAPIHTGDDEGERGIERILLGRDALDGGLYDIAVNAFSISSAVEVTLMVSSQGGAVELSNQTMVLEETCETWLGGRLDVLNQSVTPTTGGTQLWCAEEQR